MDINPAKTGRDDFIQSLIEEDKQKLRDSNKKA